MAMKNIWTNLIVMLIPILKVKQICHQLIFMITVEKWRSEVTDIWKGQ